MEHQKLRVLFKGWTQVPHSYAIVNCFQLIHLEKYFSDQLEIYVEEQPYFREEWNTFKKLVYSPQYNDIIKQFRVWNGEDVDLVYSITYPYNITANHLNKPKCVFYTSEFSWLATNYFHHATLPLINNDTITKYLRDHQEIYFTSPSVWSSHGMETYQIPKSRNRIITHGVDPDVFYLHKESSQRTKIRKHYKVDDNDILLVNIGAMTQNKGIVLILHALNVLVNKMGKTHFKLLLKGTGDLYTSKQFLEIYLEQMQRDGMLTKSDNKILLDNHIIFTDKTFSYDMINSIYNAADLYISPYLAEGFNLTCLEALSSGLPVLVPQTGSTREYIQDISENGGHQYVFYVKSTEVLTHDGMKQNYIDSQDIVDVLAAKDTDLEALKVLRHSSYTVMRNHIETYYSWKHVAKLLMQYFKDIVKVGSG